MDRMSIKGKLVEPEKTGQDPANLDRNQQTRKANHTAFTPQIYTSSIMTQQTIHVIVSKDE
jgi:hypothetical protein